MTTRILTLEDFGSRSLSSSGSNVASGDAEAIRLAGYELGYKTGWDDAVAEQEKSDRRIAVDLERNLGDLSFSYQEARAEVISGLAGLFGSILTGFLPALSAEAVLPIVMAELDKIIFDIGEGECQLITSEETAKRLEWLKETYLELELSIRAEPAYPDGRVTLTYANEAREIDLSELVEKTTTAIRDYALVSNSKMEKQHA